MKIFRLITIWCSAVPLLPLLPLLTIWCSAVPLLNESTGHIMNGTEHMEKYVVVPLPILPWWLLGFLFG